MQQKAYVTWKRMIINLTGLLIVFGVAFYILEHRSELNQLSDIPTAHIISLVILILISWLINGYQVYIIYRNVNIRMSVLESTMLSIAGTFGDHIPMRAGTLIRAFYLKDVKGLRFSHFGGIMTLRMLLSLIGAGLMGFTSLMLAMRSGSLPMAWPLLIVFGLLAFIPLLFLLAPVPYQLWKFLPRRLQHSVDNMAEAYEDLRQKPNLALMVVALVVVQYIILGLRFIIAADALQIELSIYMAFIMAPFAALMMLLAITPGALGIREAAMGYVSWETGLEFSTGVFIGAVDRVILLILTVIVGGLSFAILWRRIGR